MSATPKDLLTAIATYVVDNSFGIVGTDLFLNLLAESPRNVISVILTGGPPYHKRKLHQHQFAVYVRNADASTALTKIGSISSLFDDKFGLLGTSTFRGRFVAMGELSPPMQDDAEDTLYVRSFFFYSDS